MPIRAARVEGALVFRIQDPLLASSLSEGGRSRRIYAKRFAGTPRKDRIARADRPLPHWVQCATPAIMFPKDSINCDSVGYTGTPAGQYPCPPFHNESSRIVITIRAKPELNSLPARHNCGTSIACFARQSLSDLVVKHPAYAVFVRPRRR